VPFFKVAIHKDFFYPLKRSGENFTGHQLGQLMVQTLVVFTLLNGGGFPLGPEGTFSNFLYGILSIDIFYPILQFIICPSFCPFAHLENDAGQPQIQLEEETRVEALEFRQSHSVQSHILARLRTNCCHWDDGMDEECGHTQNARDCGHEEEYGAGNVLVVPQGPNALECFVTDEGGCDAQIEGDRVQC
jgi:hypothetical protein